MLSRLSVAWSPESVSGMSLYSGMGTRSSAVMWVLTAVEPPRFVDKLKARLTMSVSVGYSQGSEAGHLQSRLR